MKAEIVAPLAMPTLVIMRESPNHGVKVVTRLYGPVDDARKQREVAMTEYRLDQLTPTPKPAPRLFVDAQGNVHGDE